MDGSLPAAPAAARCPQADAHDSPSMRRAGPSRVVQLNAPSLAPRDTLTPAPDVLTSDPLVRARVAHPLSQLPTTLAAMEDAFQRLASRDIDRVAIARIVSKVRQYGTRAFMTGGPGPARNNAEVMARAREHLDDYYQAIGLLPHDIAALHEASRQSGRWYPSASLPVHLLQYAVPAVLAASGLPYWSVGVASLSAGLGFLLTGILQQPLAVLPSEHTAERRGPLIHVDKRRVNYAHYLPVIAPQVERLACTHRAEALAPAAALERRHAPELTSFLARASTEQRATLRQWAEDFLSRSRELDRQHRLLLSTQGAHERQALGVSRQLKWRMARPVGQGLTGLLSGVDPRALDPLAFAEQLRRVGRRQQLPPMAIAGLQMVWLLICQAGQHFSAGTDEQQKVDYKAMLDIAFADLVTPGEGSERLERGLPLEARHIDADQCRSRVLGPVQSLAKRVERVLKAEMDQAASGSPEAASLQRQLRAIQAGRFTQLDGQQDLAGRMMLQATREGIWASMLNTDSALNRDIRAKWNRAEHAVQWTQRGTQAFHFGIAGSAVSSLSTRIVTTAFGGASHTPLPYLVGALVLNTLLSWIAAWSAAETQTLKNYGKEGTVPGLDAEGGEVLRRPSTRSQIRHGLISGADLLLGRHRAARAEQAMTQALLATAEGPEAPLVLARQILSALDSQETTAPAST